jgi:hypothetical protein
VAQQLSPIAKPDDIRLTDNLPKTRSGKIMRRLLRAIARGEEITQDVSTLENPGILEQLRGEPASASVRNAKGKPAVKGETAVNAVAGAKAESAGKAKTVEAKPAKGAKPRTKGAKGKTKAAKAKTKASKAKRVKAKTKGVAKAKASGRGKAKAAARSKVRPKVVIRTKKSGRRARAKK